MFELIQAGGPVLYIIILCSIVALGFSIERFITFQEMHCNVDKFLPPLEKAIKMGKIEEATTYCEQSKGMIPKVLLIGLKHKEESLEDIRALLIEEIQLRAIPKLEKYLNVLVTIAKSTPMLGLLGTVIGMIGTFEVIAKIGLGDQQAMASNIGLALVTTAGGMMVAIPIVFIHAYFKGKIRSFELEMYNCLTKFLRLMNKRKEVEG